MELNIDHRLFKNILTEATIQSTGVADIDLSSFEIHDTLNPDIFDLENAQQPQAPKMFPKVRKALLKIGQDAYDALGVDWVEMQDLILTGSQANYNWSKFSDIDLHILMSYSKISSNATLVDEFVDAKKNLWNDEHDIKIFGYNVEIYIENVDEDNLIAGGIYSILQDKWLKIPQKRDVQFDFDRIKKIIDYFNGKFAELQKKCAASDGYGIYNDLTSLKKDIQKLRKIGLERGGEFSDENIAFKALRRMGMIDNLNDMRDSTYDNSLSIEKTADQKLRDDEPMFGKRDQAEQPIPKKEKNPNAKGLGRFKIHGKFYTSLRQAEKILGIPKSTIEYRLKSDSPEFADYIELDI